MHTILPNPTRSQSSVRPYKADSLFLIIHFFNMHMGMQWSLIIYCFSSNIQTVTHPPMSYTLPSLITTIPADLQPVPECGCCGSGGTLPPPLLGTRLEGGHADHHEVRTLKPYNINIGYSLIPRVSPTWPHSKKLMFTRNLCIEGRPIGNHA